MTQSSPTAILVGYGNWGRTLHEEIIRSGLFRVEAVVSPRIHDRDVASDHCMKFVDFHTALQNGTFETAFIAVPPQNSPSLVEVALQHNLHVFAEKPIAQTTHEAQRLCAIAESSSRILHIDYTYRYHEAVEELAVNQTGDGFPESFGLLVRDQQALDSPEDVLWLWGPHLCTLFHDIFSMDQNKEPSILTGTTLRAIGGRGSVRLELRSRHGYIGYLDYSFESTVKKRDLVVHLHQGYSSIDLTTKPPDRHLSPLQKSITAFRESIRRRNSTTGSASDCQAMCIEVTSVLEAAARDLHD